MQEGSRKAIVAAFFANLGIAVAKFVGFLLTRSAGLLAESAHSLADTGNQALLMLGSKRGKRPADREHPFGYGSERYFWAFVVALVLFSMGGLFALYEGISKLRHPHAVDNAAVAFAILVIAICLETYSLRTAVKEAKPLRAAGTGWVEFIRTSKAPELPVVLLERPRIDRLARESVRFSFSRFNTEEEITTAVAAVVKAVRRVRSLFPG